MNYYFIAFRQLEFAERKLKEKVKDPHSDDDTCLVYHFLTQEELCILTHIHALFRMFPKPGFVP